MELMEQSRGTMGLSSQEMRVERTHSSLSKLSDPACAWKLWKPKTNKQNPALYNRIQDRWTTTTVRGLADLKITLPAATPSNASLLAQLKMKFKAAILCVLNLGEIPTELSGGLFLVRDA